MSLGTLWDVDQRTLMRIGGAVFAYLFRRIDQQELIHILNDKLLSERIIESIRKDGYVLKNCKAFAWAYHKARVDCTPFPRGVDYGISRLDFKLLTHLNLLHISSEYAALTPSELDRLIRDTLVSKSISEYMGKYISKCLIFLVRSYGVERSMLESEMLAWATRAIYMRYPSYESLLHVTNQAKAAIHNCGQNQIKYYTSVSRQRLTALGDGVFEARHVNYETLVDVAADTEDKDGVKETLTSIVSLAEKKNMRPDVQRFLMCCAGQYDEEFSKFLDCDNSSLIETIAYTRYLQKARKHFKFSERQVQDLFDKLRLHLT